MVQLDLLGQVPSPESLCGLDQYCPPSGEILKREMALTQRNGVLSKDTDRWATETMGITRVGRDLDTKPPP